MTLLPAIITPSTLVRTMSPMLGRSACWRLPSRIRSSPGISSIERLNFLNNELLGESQPSWLSSTDDDNSFDGDVVRCYDAHVVDELTLRLRRISSKTINVGTTQHALMQHRQQRQQLERLRRCCENHYYSVENYQNKELSTSRSASFNSRWWPPSLIVPSPNNCDGKTLLVQTILRQDLKCDHIHVIRVGPLFAKYGSRADAALECQIHTMIVAAACRHGCLKGRNYSYRQNNSVSSSEPPLCAIILDQLELFLPPMLSGKPSSGSAASGDPSIAVVNAIASYLRKITSSMQQHFEFPFPVKNPLYNSDCSKFSGGQVLPVRICLVGIVTCPDDGWKATSRSQSQGATSSSGGIDIDGAGSIFTSLGVGGDLFRLPMLTDRGRLLALKSFFSSRGLKLDDEKVVAKLETIAGSVQWVKAGIFQNLASRLSLIVNKKGSKTSSVDTKDLDELFDSVRLEQSGVPSSPFSSLSGDVQENTRRQEAYEASASHFVSVGGAVRAKAALEDALALDPLKMKVLKQFGLRPPSGVLLYGPPGTGKTLLAKAVAVLINENTDNSQGSQSIRRRGKFISLNISDVVSSEVGTSEKTIVTTFEYADQNTPSVIFLDEFQALFTDRNTGGSGRLTTTLLQCLDNIHRWHRADEDARPKEKTDTVGYDSRPRIAVIAATNTPWMIDTAFLRSGRFDRVVQVGLPTLPERESIFSVHARRMRIHSCERGTSAPKDDKKDDVRHSDVGTLEALAQYIAQETDGYSGADLAALCRAAAVRALIADGPNAYVTRDHFSMAIRDGDVRPSSDAALVARLQSWRPGRTARK